MEVFQKIGKDQTLSQEIQHKIEEAIVNKTFLPGQKLPTEHEMCEMFAVSRTALREALQMLSARGLIRVKKGSGTYIQEIDSSYAINSMKLFLELNLNKEYLKHIIEVRKVLEPNIARLAAIHRTNSDILKLERNVQELEKCSEKNYEKQGLIDGEFHLLIANATNNPMMPIIVQPIFNIMPKIRMLVYAKVTKAQSKALIYHKSILAKIKMQDADGAFIEMKEHLRLAKEHSKIISKDLQGF